MAGKYLMSLDLGGGGGRAALLDTQSGKLTFTTCTWDFPSAGGYAFDLGSDDRWQALCQVGKEAVASAGIDPKEVAGISVTSIRHGMVLIAKDGRVLLATPNKDAQAVSESMELQDTRGEEFYHRTGHYPSPVMMASRLVWVKANHPEMLKETESVLTLSDWMAYQLCGVAAVDFTQAAETCLSQSGKRRMGV